MTAKEKQTPPDFSPDQQVADAIRAHSKDNHLACAHAFNIAVALDVPALTVGLNADALEIRLSACQLGLFGYPGKQAWAYKSFGELEASQAIERALRTAAGEENRISCARVWEIAEELGMPRLHLGYLADQLGIHIAPCQLGAF